MNVRKIEKIRKIAEEANLSNTEDKNWTVTAPNEPMWF